MILDGKERHQEPWNNRRKLTNYQNERDCTQWYHGYIKTPSFIISESLVVKRKEKESIYIYNEITICLVRYSIKIQL